MAIHSSIIAWKIPWIGDPGGLQSMGSERIGHNRAAEHNTKASLHSMIDEVIVQW